MLYNFSNDYSKFISLPLPLATLLALCNGLRTRDDITGLASELLGMSRRELDKGWLSILETCEKEGNFLEVYRGGTLSITVPNAEKIIKKMASYKHVPDVAIRLEVPLSLLILPTYDCHTDCIYCYSERPKLDKSSYLSPSRWVEIMTEAGLAGIDLLTFSGGDPLLYDGIEDMLEVATYYRMNYIIPTKSRITLKKARIISHNLGDNGVVQISVDSFDADIAFRMTGIKDYAEEARTSIRYLVESGVPVRTNSVITPINLNGVERMIRELKSLGVYRANFSNYYRTFYRHNDALFLNSRQMEELNATVKRVGNELGWSELKCNAEPRDFSLPDPNRKGTWKSRSKCSGGFSSLVILPNGDVILCEQVPHAAPFVIGNLKSKTIAEIWNSEELKNFIAPDRSLFSQTVCEKCEEFDECHRIYGRCFRDAFFSYGSPYAPSPTCPQAPPALRMA